ncbi:phenol-soluble modulin PSM-alpha-4, partial [Staphylococcus aureus]
STIIKIIKAIIDIFAK